MLTDKVRRILQSKSDFTEEQMSHMTETQAWAWVYEHDRAKQTAATPRCHQICFTGFGKSERTELEQKAVSIGMEVKESVTTTLAYLCAGPAAGPFKLAKARTQGTAIMTAEQFHLLCETGELGEAAG